MRWKILVKTNPYKKLLDNSIIFVIGNVGSKLITFLMLPVYTYTLSKQEYGVTDLVTATVGLLLPIFFLSVSDAVLRFGLDHTENRTVVFMGAFTLTTLMSVIVLVSTGVAQLFQVPYALYLGLILISQGYQQLFAQMSKAIGKQRIFAANGILLAFFTAILNILFLVFFKWGIDGFFISLFLANVLSNTYLFFRIKIFSFVSKQAFKLSKLKEMLKYSVPLVPNAIAWWGTNDINRYLILYFLGSSYNGLFAVSSKIPSVINLLNSIFFQSWQLSAIEEFNDDNREKFFSNIFKFYSEFLFLGTLVLICFSKVFMRVIVSTNFYEAWKYSPFLLIATLYQCFSGLVGQIFVASKKTKEIFSTTIYGVIFNVGLTAMLLPIIGLQGAGISSAFSFFAVWIIRQIRIKKIITLTINWKNFIINNTLVLLQTGLLFLQLNIWQYIVLSAIILLIGLILNRELLAIVLRTIMQRLNV